MRAEILALFGDFKAAYPRLKEGDVTQLDNGDTAIVLTETNNLQLFLPESGEVSDRGLVLVEVYNALCRERAGTVNDKGEPLPDNEPYVGFSEPYIAAMKQRVHPDV